MTNTKLSEDKNTFKPYSQAFIVSTILNTTFIQQNLNPKHAIIISELMIRVLAKEGFCKKSTLVSKRTPSIKLNYAWFKKTFSFSKDVTNKLLAELVDAGFIQKSKDW